MFNSLLYPLNNNYNKNSKNHEKKNRIVKTIMAMKNSINLFP